jgi:hypothetical protein
LENEKEVFKLADYFITVGIDDYHTPDETYGNRAASEEEKKK